MTDWLSPWAEFRFEVEEVMPVDDMIVMLVRQTGTTKHGGVEVTTESGTIWWVAGRADQAGDVLPRPRDAMFKSGRARCSDRKPARLAAEEPVEGGE